MKSGGRAHLSICALCSSLFDSQVLTLVLSYTARLAQPCCSFSSPFPAMRPCCHHLIKHPWFFCHLHCLIATKMMTSGSATASRLLPSGLCFLFCLSCFLLFLVCFSPFFHLSFPFLLFSFPVFFTQHTCKRPTYQSSPSFIPIFSLSLPSVQRPF